MKSDYDEIIRNAFSEKIEVPKEYQQKIKETLKQARIASSQKESSSGNIFLRTDGKAENFFQRHKISVRTCLSLTGGICACLGLIIVLSVFLQDRPEKDLRNTPYTKISATPAATENTVTADNALRTEIPADTESPWRTKLPLDTTKPTLTVVGTHIPEKTKTPENNIPALTSEPRESTAPNLGTMLPSSAETPAGTPGQTSTMPTST